MLAEGEGKEERIIKFGTLKDCVKNKNTISRAKHVFVYPRAEQATTGMSVFIRRQANVIPNQGSLLDHIPLNATGMISSLPAILPK